jgi:glycosyltransferase involved in cell wall biosynthesis
MSDKMAYLAAALFNDQPERAKTLPLPRSLPAPTPMPGSIKRGVSFAFKKAKRLHVRERLVTLKTSSRKQGDVLLSYMTAPVLFKSDHQLPHHHSNFWECRQIARTFLALGYDVDVIESDNKFFIPHKDYAVFVEHRFVLARIAGQLEKSCLKINHVDTAHPTFNNYAEAKRLYELQGRRGATLSSERLLKLNFAYENADCATVLGNDFTMSTYLSDKPMIRTPISAPFVYPWPQHKNYDLCRNRFLWLGSGGLVHKGLDLVLEAFARMPEMDLVVCGPLDAEPAFTQAYRHELTELSNVVVAGFVDVGSAEFQSIAANCVGVISASCSEGGCGAVITAMHAGLIPIVSRESAVDVGQFGVTLPSSSVEDIVATVRTLAGLPTNELEERARTGWEHVRQHHTQASFAASYRSGILRLLDWKGLHHPAIDSDDCGEWHSSKPLMQTKVIEVVS